MRPYLLGDYADTFLLFLYSAVGNCRSVFSAFAERGRSGRRKINQITVLTVVILLSRHGIGHPDLSLPDEAFAGTAGCSNLVDEYPDCRFDVLLLLGEGSRQGNRERDFLIIMIGSLPASFAVLRVWISRLEQQGGGLSFLIDFFRSVRRIYG
jgi:hypothetical protein